MPAKMGNSYECSSSLPSTLKEKWMRETQQGVTTIATTDEDVASAMLAALELKAGFQAFDRGDFEQKLCAWQKPSV